MIYQVFKKCKSPIFADDTNLAASEDSISKIEVAVNSDLKNRKSWLIANKPSLNVAETEFMFINPARIIMNMSNGVDHNMALALDWEPLKLMRIKARAKLVYESLNKTAPKTLTNLFYI